MTRAEAFRKAADILDDVVERELERFLDHHDRDHRRAAALRAEMEAWKQQQLAEIEKAMSEMVRSFLH